MIFKAYKVCLNARRQRYTDSQSDSIKFQTSPNFLHWSSRKTANSVQGRPERSTGTGGFSCDTAYSGYIKRPTCGKLVCKLLILDNVIQPSVGSHGGHNFH